jgi:plasmid stabilization system protein ParE
MNETGRFPKKTAREHQISWVEYELLRAKHGAEWEKSAIAERPTDLEIWLAKEKDNKSWKAIGDFYFRRSKPEARRSEARRARDRVERYLRNPNAPEFYEHELRQLILERFNVSAEAFRAFILKGHLPRKG